MRTTAGVALSLSLATFAVWLAFVEPGHYLRALTVACLTAALVFNVATIFTVRDTARLNRDTERIYREIAERRRGR